MNIVGLPASLTGAAVVVAALVSSLLSAFGVLIAQVPGLRLTDASRNILMRVVVGALNLAGLVAFAWINNLVIAKEMLPALLATAAGFGVVGGHYVYKGVQSVQQTLATGLSVTTPAGPTDTVLPFSAPTPSNAPATPPPAGSFTASTPASS